MIAGDNVTVCAKGTTERHEAVLLDFDAGGQTCYPHGAEPYVRGPKWQVRITSGYYKDWIVSVDPNDIAANN